jgi:hypothetical protein
MNACKLIAITVSTNYSDLLPYIIESNIKYFDKWIFITSKNDIDTISQLSNKDKIQILTYDFQNSDKIFDKGGAILNAQDYVYEKYPDDWYLLIDSDICLSDNFLDFLAEINNSVEEDTLYGASRRLNFGSLQDFKNIQNHTDYTQSASSMIDGYFQLYKSKFYYSKSMDASECDWTFNYSFKYKKHLNSFTCHHLGKNGNWKGRIVGSDFIIN